MKKPAASSGLKTDRVASRRRQRRSRRKVLKVVVKKAKRFLKKDTQETKPPKNDPDFELLCPILDPTVRGIGLQSKDGRICVWISAPSNPEGPFT
eukprot:9064094-Alexandrium_andersonii.AAC.1